MTPLPHNAAGQSQMLTIPLVMTILAVNLVVLEEKASKKLLPMTIDSVHIEKQKKG